MIRPRASRCVISDISCALWGEIATNAEGARRVTSVARNQSLPRNLRKGVVTEFDSLRNDLVTSQTVSLRCAAIIVARMFVKKDGV